MKYNIDMLYSDSFKTSSKERQYDKNPQKSKFKHLEDNEELLRKKKFNKKDYSKERQAKTGYQGAE